MLPSYWHKYQVHKIDEQIFNMNFAKSDQP